MSPTRPCLLLCLVLALTGCGDPQEEGTPQTDDNNTPCQGEDCPDDMPEPEPEPEPQPDPGSGCTPGTSWSPGSKAFEEATASWGLDTLAVQGARLSVADIDNDGWPDLIVRRGGNRSDDFGAEGARHSWVLRNTGDGQFEDTTLDSGLRQTRSDPTGALGHPGEVLAFADVDNDGTLDAYAGFNTTVPDLPVAETSEVFLGQGAGRFGLAPEGSELRRLSDVPAGATFVDFDRDGFIDLWIAQNAPVGENTPVQDRLYKGDGTGHFVDVTESVGLETFNWTLGNLNAAMAHSLAWSSAACDLNNDGIPELLAASYGRAPNHLWQGGGDVDGGFEWRNRSIGSRYAYDQRQDWQDNESARCFCTLNPDAPDCAGVPEPQFIRCNTNADAFRWNHNNDRNTFRLGGVSGTTVCADINNDGAMDLLTTEIVHWDVGTSADPSELLFNDGQQDMRFERPGNEVTGLMRERNRVDWNDGDITAAVFDFDNDGWPDVYIGSTDYPGARGLLFHQTDAGKFEPVPITDGIEHNRSHGVAVADFDRDGDLDLIVGNSRARCSGSDDCYDTPQVRFFENRLGDAGHWLQLHLEGGEGTNRSAIGARVEVTAGGVTQTQEIGGGHGHYGIQHDMTLHFGLGEACEASVTVRWPNAELTTQTFTVSADRRYTLVQGEEVE